MIFFLYLIILSGFIFSRGFFTYNGIFLMFLAIALFSFLTIKPKASQIKLISPQLLLLILGLLSLVMYGGLYQSNYILIFSSFLLLGLNAALLLIHVLRPNDDRNALWFMLVIAILLRLFMIWSSPSPRIDVYDYLKNGAVGFVHGQNPYSMTYTKLYQGEDPDFYSYLPAMLYLTLPSVVLLGDPRYTLIIVEIFTVFMIYKMAKNKNKGLLYGLVILNHPSALYITEQSYTEPIIIALFMFFAYLFYKKKYLLNAVMFGILLSTKQYSLLVVPFLFRLLKIAEGKARWFAAFIITAGFIILPFYFWNKTDFLHDAVFLQYNFPPRYEGLSFFSFLFRFGLVYNVYVSGFLIILFMLYILKYQKNTISSFFFSSSFLFLVFFFFNKWAFINYYFLVSELLLLSAAFNEEKI